MTRGATTSQARNSRRISREQLTSTTAQCDRLQQSCHIDGLNVRCDRGAHRSRTRTSIQLGPDQQDVKLTQRLCGSTFQKSGVRIGCYRPFSHAARLLRPQAAAQQLYVPTPVRCFPTPHHKNIGFYVVGAGSDVPFSALMTGRAARPSRDWRGQWRQFFPRWTYEKA